MEWSPQQGDALKGVAAWHRTCMQEIAADCRLSQPIYRVFGYAGTGKSTLATHFADSIGGDTVYAAYTGKAAMVMRKAGCKDASTIHSLIYTVKVDESDGRVKFLWNKHSAAADADLICIDECSMVDEKIGRGLLRFRRPILVLGDPMQLPPVKSDKARKDGTGAGFFTEAKPDHMLTEIHRQARDNPIIALASDIRETGRFSGSYGDGDAVRIYPWGDFGIRDVQKAEQLLVGRTATRARFNARMREIHGHLMNEPAQGERLVCRKNDSNKGIFNGGIFETVAPAVLNEADQTVDLVVQSLDQPDTPKLDVACRIESFTGGYDAIHWTHKRGFQHFEYAYALTVHSAQGSQWGHVALFDESGVFGPDGRRWLYTAVTRAAERVDLITRQIARQEA